MRSRLGKRGGHCDQVDLYLYSRHRRPSQARGKWRTTLHASDHSLFWRWTDDFTPHIVLVNVLWNSDLFNFGLALKNYRFFFTYRGSDTYTLFRGDQTTTSTTFSHICVMWQQLITCESQQEAYRRTTVLVSICSAGSGEQLVKPLNLVTQIWDAACVLAGEKSSCCIMFYELLTFDALLKIEMRQYWNVL